LEFDRLFPLLAFFLTYPFPVVALFLGLYADLELWQLVSARQIETMTKKYRNVLVILFNCQAVYLKLNLFTYNSNLHILL
jgi:hypothetical protein